FTLHADSVYNRFIFSGNPSLNLNLKLHYADACSTLTDSVLIRIPGKPAITSHFTDTAVCLNTPFAFPLSLNGGDSSLYKIHYYKNTISPSNFLATHNTALNADSLYLTVSPG